MLELTIRTQAGQVVPVSLSGSVMASEDPRFQGCIFVARNITERKRAERRIRYLARYDTLTKIPNRLQFQHSLQQAIARSRRAGRELALIYLDLDQFKQVNDTFGHSAGDRALEILSERMNRKLPADTMLGRLAGDEFALFVENLPPDTDNRAAISALARELLDELGRPFQLEPARAVRDRQRRHRLLPARCRQRGGPDPRRRRGDVLLEAERRQQPQLLHAGDERGRGRTADAEGQAAPRGRARRARDHVPAQGGPARRPRGRRRGADPLAPAGPRRHFARRSSSRWPRNRT